MSSPSAEWVGMEAKQGETVNEAGSKAMVWQTPSSLLLGWIKNVVLKKGKKLVQHEGRMAARSRVQGGARLYRAPK